MEKRGTIDLLLIDDAVLARELDGIIYEALCARDELIHQLTLPQDAG